MPTFDQRCQECNHEWVVYKAFEAPATCPECNSTTTKTLMPRVQGLPLESDPTRVGNTDKTIKSFGNDRRRGGKDTS